MDALELQIARSKFESSVSSDRHPESRKVEQLKSEQKIFAGMIPKLDNAFAALNRGVKKVIIGKAEQLTDIITGKAGTSIVA